MIERPLIKRAEGTHKHPRTNTHRQAHTMAENSLRTLSSIFTAICFTDHRVNCELIQGGLSHAVSFFSIAQTLSHNGQSDSVECSLYEIMHASARRFNVADACCCMNPTE